jgi:3'-5' exoribonuclease
MIPGQEADLFALLSAKQELLTREGKKYHRVTFRDARREVTFPIWSDTVWADACEREWTPGLFYKLRAQLRETNYGLQLEILKIREVTEADRADGFDAAMCLARSRYDPAEMFAELVAWTEEWVENASLKNVVITLLESHRDALLTWPAATRNHHAFAGGFLEHVLSVARNAAFLADKYDADYPDLRPRLDKSLVVAGAILHDIGKLRELEVRAEGAVYSPAGSLIGHTLQGRDMVREAAATVGLDGDRLLRLEHIVVSHQRLPEWGAPKPPMTPEALLVHYADDVDAKFHMMYTALRDDPGDGALTSRKNPLGQQVYRGEAWNK